jgi:hypothetical protein
MSQAKTVKQVLTAAKWMIENIGWTKGIFAVYNKEMNGPVAFCAAGAINRVEVDNYNLLSSARMMVSDAAGQNLVSFNDGPNTTKEDVLKAFDKAIKGKKS